ncbi:hypothetical protein KIN20_033445 [Parelaphostrongylus tenuis]|uniref:Uncharacterized protein n=1 Tax=Parelaphostrongylus tenuis TaxID=148309 RepID=A0AAD5WJ81_PARTN|nr:hypothetical protein KIN20_033445 [Parelaphostrongylus tenuis]
MKKYSAHVQQEDVLITEVTVEEQPMFAVNRTCAVYRSTATRLDRLIYPVTGP